MPEQYDPALDPKVPCTGPCDYCGNSPARWFGNTSVRVCVNATCLQQVNSDWEENINKTNDDDEW